MTFRKRPEWDLRFWTEAGFAVDVREGINPLIYDAEDQARYRKYPMFMAAVRRK